MQRCRGSLLDLKGDDSSDATVSSRSLAPRPAADGRIALANSLIEISPLPSLSILLNSSSMVRREIPMPSSPRASRISRCDSLPLPSASNSWNSVVTLLQFAASAAATCSPTSLPSLILPLRVFKIAPAKVLSEGRCFLSFSSFSEFPSFSACASCSAVSSFSSTCSSSFSSSLSSSCSSSKCSVFL